VPPGRSSPGGTGGARWRVPRGLPAPPRPRRRRSARRRGRWPGSRRASTASAGKEGMSAMRSCGGEIGSPAAIRRAGQGRSERGTGQRTRRGSGAAARRRTLRGARSSTAARSPLRHGRARATQHHRYSRRGSPTTTSVNRARGAPSSRRRNGQEKLTRSRAPRLLSTA
jgi:hypothetical protein